MKIIWEFDFLKINFLFQKIKKKKKKNDTWPLSGALKGGHA